MPKTAPADPPAQKKRSTIASAARRRRARRANPAPAARAGDLTETLKDVAIAAGAYGGTRLIQRVAWTVAAKKRPSWAKHVHAAAGLAAFAGALFGARRVKQLEPYVESIVIGAGVAAAQGIVSAYIPKYAPLLNDVRLADLGPKALPNPHEQAHAQGGYDDHDQLDAALRQYETGPKRKKAPVQQALQTAAMADGGDLGIDPGLLEELGTENIDDLYGGVFEDPTLSN